MSKSIIAVICLLCLGTVQSCKEKSVQPLMEFSGITETNSTGPDPIGKIDPDDWKPMMDCPASQSSIKSFSFKSSSSDTEFVKLTNCTKIYPAYPNPANKSFIIEFSLSESNTVLITLNSTPSTIVKEILNSKHNAGTYSITIDGSDLKPAIYRVYIKVFSQSGVLSSYGDVRIVE